MPLDPIPGKTRNLDALKEKLWEVFDKASGKTYEDSTASGSSTPFNPTIENRKMLAQVALAITASSKSSVRSAMSSARKKNANPARKCPANKEQTDGKPQESR